MNKHHDCLQTISALLNRAQDIEDTLRDYEEGRQPDLVKRIREINNRALETAAAYLPE